MRSSFVDLSHACVLGHGSSVSAQVDLLWDIDTWERCTRNRGGPAGTFLGFRSGVGWAWFLGTVGWSFGERAAMVCKFRRSCS